MTWPGELALAPGPGGWCFAPGPQELLIIDLAWGAGACAWPGELVLRTWPAGAGHYWPGLELSLAPGLGSWCLARGLQELVSGHLSLER